MVDLVLFLSTMRLTKEKEKEKTTAFCIYISFYLAFVLFFLAFKFIKYV